MKILILNTQFEAISTLDIFESFIWVDRYNTCGDFEITLKFTPEIFAILAIDNYVWQSNSEHLMIIESTVINESSADGVLLTVSGRSSESILDRRIILNPLLLTGTIQNGIRDILQDNVIAPEDVSRTMPVIMNTNTHPVLDEEFITYYSTETVLEAISEITDTFDIGFKLIRPENSPTFIFELYVGVDRTYDQLTNPYVVFSPSFDNINNTNYAVSKKNQKTIVYVDGEADDDGAIKSLVSGYTTEGMDRRESYLNATHISSTQDEVTLTDDEYYTLLNEKGLELLSGHKIEQVFDGDADTRGTFQYGIDYSIGDKVQFVSSYNIMSTARITEIIFSINSEGTRIYPTFSIIQ